MIIADELIDSWPMMGSPYQLLSLAAVYLWIVFKAGPKFMENRKAFKLNNFTRIYNLYQIAGCLFIVLGAPKLGFSYNFWWRCIPAPKASDAITDTMMTYYTWHWYFIILRASEFLETVVFVLRKKQNQVSFLHVYHHIAVVALLWTFLKYSSGLGESFIAVVNSAVHVMMYSYYFLSSFSFLKNATSKVKPLITALQIVQLVALFSHCLISIFSCGASTMYYLQAGNLGFLVFMFVKFYGKSYSKSPKVIRVTEYKRKV